MHSTVRDVMTRQVATVVRSTPYKDIVRVLFEHRISAVPVLDEAGRVDGIVSEADLIEKEALRADERREVREPSARRPYRGYDRAHAVSAGTLMTSPAVTITQGSGLGTAARLMRKHAVKRLPVVDGVGRLVGIVSRADLLTPYLRLDIDIHNEIVREVLIRAMSVDQQAVEVRVRDGVVTLTGRVGNEYVACDTAHLAREVDGVVEVVDRLTPSLRANPYRERSSLITPAPRSRR